LHLEIDSNLSDIFIEKRCLREFLLEGIQHSLSETKAPFRCDAPVPTLNTTAYPERSHPSASHKNKDPSIIFSHPESTVD
jgi:hypothetical protein